MTMKQSPSVCARKASILALALFAIGCASMGEQSDLLPIPGCYYFVQDEAAGELHLPWGVRLTDEALDGWPAIQRRGDVNRAATLTDQGDVGFPFGYWILAGADSVEIGYPAGGGLLLDLAVENGALRGTARPVGDVLPPPGPVPERVTHSVALTRARCPEE
jgi:hypothetical protein